MHGEITVELSELVCIHPNRGRWPSHVLFVLAALGDGAPAVALVGPHWMVDGERRLFQPPLALAAAGAPPRRIGVAVLGLEFGPDRRWDERPLALELILSTARRRLSLLAPPGETGTAWDEGLAALEIALKERLASPAEQIFHFSKIYQVDEGRQRFTLSHSVSDQDGGVCARYKLVLDLVGNESADSGVSTSGRTG